MNLENVTGRGRPGDYCYTLMYKTTAHWIRNPTSKIFRAAASISARNRWCLTGTPIQNKLEDLMTLAEFLRLAPLESRRQFDARVLTPLSVGAGDPAKILKAYLQRFCLRRGYGCLKLPSSNMVDVELELSEREKADYQRVVWQAKQKMDDIASKKQNARFSILFTMIVKLRRLCNIGMVETESCGTLNVFNTNNLEIGCDFCQATDEDTRLLLSSYTFCPQCSFTLQPSSPLPEGDASTPAIQNTPTPSLSGGKSYPGNVAGHPPDHLLVPHTYILRISHRPQ